MTIGAQTRTKIGPRLGGRDTTLTILSSEQTARSRFLPELVKTINAAFGEANASLPELGMIGQADRLGSTDEFLANLSTNPESFVLVISHPDSDKVIATASYRRYLGPLKDRPIDRNTPWFRTTEVSPETEEWELKLMATGLGFQGHGLAAYMMKVGEAEIVNRFRQKQLVAKRSGYTSPAMLKLVICTPMELTGQFYLRRGFTMDYQVWRGEGYKFHIAFMHRLIEIPPPVDQ